MHRIAPFQHCALLTTTWKQKLQKSAWAYFYLAPMLILLLVFSVYPTIVSAIYTLYKWDGIGQPSQYVGLRNFIETITDRFFWNAFLHTAIFTVVTVSIQLTLALVLAIVLNHPYLKFSTFYRTVYFLPVITSQAVTSVVIQLLLTTSGSQLNDFLVHIHLIETPIDWLGNSFWAFVILCMVGIWNSLGINMVNFLAALQSIPAELYEAAQIDGANALTRFFFITVPLLRNVGGVITILAILEALGTFDLVQVITGGGPYYATEVVSTYIYHTAFGRFGGPGTMATPDVGLASAASFFFGVSILGLTLGQIVIVRNAIRLRKDITELT